MNKEDKIKAIIAGITEIYNSAIEQEKQYSHYLEKVHPKFRESARNLIHYRALRSFDLRNLQKKLGNLGLSRLAKAESHVLASLATNIGMLRLLIGLPKESFHDNFISIKEGQKLQTGHANDLFGPSPENRKVRIMVTLPDEGAHQLFLLRKMIVEGMNIIRINCARDDYLLWDSMIANAHKAMKTVGQTCKISMDLGGPKIRTGPIAPGPKAVRLRPEKDDLGKVVAPAVAYLTTGGCKIDSPVMNIPINQGWTEEIKKGDKIVFSDARNKKRQLRVVEVMPGSLLVHANKTCYLQTGIDIHVENKGSSTIGELPCLEGYLLLNKGDNLVIHGEPLPGENAVFNKKGKLVSPAHISCTHPGVLDFVKPGEPIMFDDGKIEGVIKEVRPKEMIVEITTFSEKGLKLRADKGINLPDSALQIPGLTAKDKEDLKYIAANADAVNMSFVNNKQDVQDLIDEMRKLNVENNLGLILKIETKSGFLNLVEILLTAMQVYPVGVMIARGDLAIECGWENIGRIQEEILWLCQAAHMPTIWATQVLENMAKKGIPSRAEITDAVMSQRADCVMLNKGPHIVNAIAMLHHILQNMQNYQDRKAPMLPAIEMKL